MFEETAFSKPMVAEAEIKSSFVTTLFFLSPSLHSQDVPNKESLQERW